MAAGGGLGYQLGAMVGESGILTAAGRHFLQMVPGVTFTEISYGTFLLQEDIVDQQMRFGYKGRLSKKRVEKNSEFRREEERREEMNPDLSGNIQHSIRLRRIELKKYCNCSRFLSACGGLSFALSGLLVVVATLPGAYATRLCALSALRA